MCKISVVTVVYNDVANLEATIQSVINQSYSNIEYLIIDGLSTDGTLDIIKHYQADLALFISEKDKGIYDAMNKGIAKANGDWLIFLNSGDKFYNNNVVEHVVNNYLSKYEADVFYGNVAVVNKEINKSYIVTSSPVNELNRKMVMNHQACFIKRDLHQEMIYEVRYKIAADYDFFLKAYYNSKKFIRMPLPISYISLGGLSDANPFKVFKEVLDIKNDAAPALYNYLYYLKQAIYTLVAKSVKIIMPVGIKRKIFGLKYNKSN